MPRRQAQDTPITHNLRYHRSVKDMSQQEVADRIGGINRSTIANWERGSQIPDFEEAIKLANIYDVSLDELAAGAVSEREQNLDEMDIMVKANKIKRILGALDKAERDKLIGVVESLWGKH